MFATAAVGRWKEMADMVLSGEAIRRDDARAILEAPDEELLEVLAAAYQVRHHVFGNTVQLYFLVNAKSGLCPEDCGYCSQSKVADTDINRYSLLNSEQLLDGARCAHERSAKTYCIVLAGRGPNQRELEGVCDAVLRIKEQYPLKICACMGLLTDEQAQRLKAAGVDRVNHNLNTSERYYDSICSTHSFQDRLTTLRAVRAAGLELCSGGIVGMGETLNDIVEMAFVLRDLNVESIPVNFLNPVTGTPLEDKRYLQPRFCLKVLAMFRMVNPNSEIRIAGGREMHLRSLQPLGLYPANSLFVGDYLTTKGQLPDEDYRMIADMGFTITNG